MLASRFLLIVQILDLIRPLCLKPRTFELQRSAVFRGPCGPSCPCAPEGISASNATVRGYLAAARIVSPFIQLSQYCIFNHNSRSCFSTGGCPRGTLSKPLGIHSLPATADRRLDCSPNSGGIQSIYRPPRNRFCFTSFVGRVACPSRKQLGRSPWPWKDVEFLRY
jgi:hypothetical protein